MVCGFTAQPFNIMILYLTLLTDFFANRAKKIIVVKKSSKSHCICKSLKFSFRIHDV